MERFAARSTRRAFFAGVGGSLCARAARLPQGSSRRIAITVDDLPAARRAFLTSELEEFDSFRNRQRGFLKALHKRKAPVAGFLTEGWRPHAWSREQLEILLSDWLDSGAALGNHTFSHVDLHEVGLERFRADLVLGEAVLGSLLARYGRRLEYVRHPYLHTGLDGEERRALNQYLRERSYRIAPVTVDTQDWIFAEIYAWAARRGDEPRRAEAVEAYQRYLGELVDHVERICPAERGDEPPQVLLLHASALNYDHISGVLNVFTERGYRFVSLDEALAHPAYEEEVPALGSWVHGWRNLQGLDPAPDPDPAPYLGNLLEDYRVVEAARPEAGAPNTARISDSA